MYIVNVRWAWGLFSQGTEKVRVEGKTQTIKINPKHSLIFRKNSITKKVTKDKEGEQNTQTRGWGEEWARGCVLNGGRRKRQKKLIDRIKKHIKLPFGEPALVKMLYRIFGLTALVQAGQREGLEYSP